MSRITVWESLKSLENRQFLKKYRHPEAITNAKYYQPTDKGIAYATGYLDVSLHQVYFNRVSRQSASQFGKNKVSNIAAGLLAGFTLLLESVDERIKEQNRIIFRGYSRLYYECGLFDDKGNFTDIETIGKKEENTVLLDITTDPRIDPDTLAKLMQGRSSRVRDVVKMELERQKRKIEDKLKMLG